jgi:hypothetical protein
MKSHQVFHFIVPVIIISLLFVLSISIYPFDGAHQAVIPCSGKLRTVSGSACWTPAASDVEKADRILFDCIRQKCKSPELLSDIANKGFDNYFRQYTGTFGARGEKLIRMYCMCAVSGSLADWCRNVIIIHGGGRCYFDAVINTASMKCEEFHVNSPR